MNKQITLFGEEVKQEQPTMPPGQHSDELDAPEGDEDYKTESSDEDDLEYTNEVQDSIFQFLEETPDRYVPFKAIVKHFTDEDTEIDENELHEQIDDLIVKKMVRRKGEAYQAIEQQPEKAEAKHDDVIGDEVIESLKTNDKYTYRQVKDTGSEHGYDLFHIALNIKLDRTEISISHSTVMPKDMLGSSWGGGGGCLLDELPPFFENIMATKQMLLKQPYTDKRWKKENEKDFNEQTPDHYFRNIKADRYFVSIPDKAIAMLKEQCKFDFEKWYKEYKAVPEYAATPEQIKKAEMAAKLHTEGENLSDELDKAFWVIDGLEKSNCKEFLGLNIADLKDRLRKEGLRLFKIRKELGTIEDTLERFYLFSTADNPSASMKGRREWGNTLDRLGITKQDGKILLASLD